MDRPIRVGDMVTWSDIGSERERVVLRAVDDAISLIQGVRDHIDDALAEVRRVLT